MGATNRTTLKLLDARGARRRPGRCPTRSWTRSWRTSTRARSARSCSSTARAREQELAAAGARLGELRCPALVVWGDRDPYIPPLFADRYAAALGGPASVRHLPDAGHWPWLEQPELIDESPRSSMATRPLRRLTAARPARGAAGAAPLWLLTAALRGALADLSTPPTPRPRRARVPRGARRARIGFGDLGAGLVRAATTCRATACSSRRSRRCCRRSSSGRGRVVIAAWCFERLARGALGAGGRRAPRDCGSRSASSRRSSAASSRSPPGSAPALGGAARGAARAPGARRGARAPRRRSRAPSRRRSSCSRAPRGGWTRARRRAAAVAAGAIVPGPAIVLAFPQGGMQPFSVSSFAWLVRARVGVAARCRRATSARCAPAPASTRRAASRACCSTRRSAATSCASPRSSAARSRRARSGTGAGRCCCVLALPLLYWQWLAPRALGDPRRAATRRAQLAYHAPLIAELDRRAAAEGPFRTEVPFTREPLGDAPRPAATPARARLGAPARREAQRRSSTATSR